jgi:hypothetical protein
MLFKAIFYVRPYFLDLKPGLQKSVLRSNLFLFGSLVLRLVQIPRNLRCMARIVFILIVVEGYYAYEKFAYIFCRFNS